MTLLRPESPNVYSAGSEKQLVLNHSDGLGFAKVFGSHDTLGRCAGPDPTLARSVPKFTVNGEPDCTVTMPLTRHPRPSVARVVRPPGSDNAYMTCPTNRWR